MWARRLMRGVCVCAPAAVPAAASLRLRRDGRTLCDSLGAGPGPTPSFSVASYNVLCSTYAVKWGEREGVGADGASNWVARWPAMRDIMRRACWDVVCLQEVEYTDADDIVAGLGAEYQAHYFKHAKRPPDGVLIAVRGSAANGSLATRELQWKSSVAFGCVAFTLSSCARRVRVITAHMRGKNLQQLADLQTFADEGSPVDITVITGDFNEDFGTGEGNFSCPFVDGPLGCWVTLHRDSGLPEVSRPPHKQGPDQKSGKGKIDFIFVRANPLTCGAELFRDQASREAIIASHGPCQATGQWPSDHGAEALSVLVQ